MQRGHGDAERLIGQEHVDQGRIDEAIRSGGASDEEAVRMIMANGFLGPNRFGKMFPDLTPFRPPDEALINLGLAMSESQDQTSSSALDSDIPAGFTYLGQFIDHDITNDPSMGFPVIDDPTQLRDARTPTLDIDSVYGLGPGLQPELYDQSFTADVARFIIGLTSDADSPSFDGGVEQVSLPNDLPRREKTQASKIDLTALIGDPRNDENLIVAQTHLAFLKFHNKVMDTMINTLPQDGNGSDDETPFDKLRRLVTWHYQWIVLNDFLPRVIDPSILDDVRTNGRKFYDFSGDPFDGTPFMPVEFSVAAYRLGHSMIRDAYNYNRDFNLAPPPTAIAKATLGFLFRFTGGGGFLGDNKPLPSDWIIDWRRFHEVGDPRPQLVNLARRLDTLLSPTLFNLPVQPPIISAPPIQLAVRNLLRGSRLGLSTGQDVAQAIGATALTPDEILSGPDNQAQALRANDFQDQTPLWFYVLKEADVQGQGNRLGEVGSRILSEVFVGILQGDPGSFLSQQPDWTPTLPSTDSGNFTMADLLNFVGDINPLGLRPGNE